MFEFEAIGPEDHLHWRREITPGVTVRLGRMPDSGWQVSWDRRISREHADLALTGNRLSVRCLPDAKNAANVAGRQQREFTISSGEQFRIGDTVFRFETVEIPAPLQQMDDDFSAAAQALREDLASLQCQLSEAGSHPGQQSVGDACIQALAADIQEVKDLWQTESKSLHAASQQIEEQGSEIRALQENAAGLAAALAAEQDLHEQTRKLAEQHKLEAAELRQHCAKLNSPLKESGRVGRRHAATRKAELERARELARRNEQTSAQLHDELDAVKAELERLNSKVTDTEAARRRAEMEAKQQVEEARHNTRENESLQAEVDSLRAELRAKDASIRKAELTVRHKSEEVSRYLDELKEVRSEVFNLRVRGDSSSGSSSPGTRRSATSRELLPDDVGKPVGQGSTLSKLSELGTFGQYKIIQQIGQGGMGTVFKAIHTRLERLVALKIVTGGRLQSDDKLARFDQEMKAIGRLTHPNLVQAMDAGENNHCLYLVMEFVEGLDVGGLVQRVGSLPIADACEIIRQSALGLDYIHQQELVHRDMKPSNLMITPDEQVKILDLGLALLGELGDGLTQTGQLMGTLDYMSPEQAGDSHQVDYRADIYSLGCTFYQLLSGKVPYGDMRYLTVVKKIMAHAQAETPDLGKECPDLPVELADVINRMMAKNPAERPQSAAEVAGVVEKFCAGTSLSQLLVRAGVLREGHARTTMTVHTGIDSTDCTDADQAGEKVPGRAAVSESDARIDAHADQPK